MTTTTKLEALGLLRDATAAIGNATLTQARAVAQARQLGATWDEIGECVHMAGPNAYRAFKPYLKERNDTLVIQPIVDGKPCPDCGRRVTGSTAESTEAMLPGGEILAETIFVAYPCGHRRGYDF
ncbi:hypothetical protein [Micromonospora sp. WMMD1082]|uniref:hypothetical protein n=1 Tax=Micromonospora sp. WMMD1082 TaxID=3016104 RepID=UPI002417B2BB|nr:hypothetical protein [Micromonospora sp. WMMD1082]MDG4796394.1 hypothetical protein [Micromonospora sp. WMMD1082]